MGHHPSDIEDHSTALNITHAPSICPSSVILQIILILHVRMVLPFQCQTLGVIRRGPLQEWLFSLSNMHLRYFVSFCGLGTQIFFFITESHFTLWVDHGLFVRSPKEKLCCSFQVVAVTGKALINTRVQALVWAYIVSLGEY